MIAKTTATSGVTMDNIPAISFQSSARILVQKNLEAIAHPKVHKDDPSAIHLSIFADGQTSKIIIEGTLANK